MLPDMYDPQQLNRYAYVRNNPLKYVDPSGHWLDVAIEAVSISYDLTEFYNNPNLENGAYLVVDVVLVVVPIVPGVVGPAAKGVKVAGKIDDAVDTAKAVDKGTDVLKHADDAPTFPNEVWDQKAPKQTTPGGGEINQTRYNPKTGEMEQSTVKYDEYGRQVERVDYTDHGTSEHHTNPHKHTTEYHSDKTGGNGSSSKNYQTDKRYDYNKSSGNYTPRPATQSSRNGCDVVRSCVNK